MELSIYFFDTYAFYEILDGNTNYQNYKKAVSIVTTRLNLMELHYGLLLNYGKEYADLCYNELLKFVVEISDDIIKLANNFRVLYKDRKMSYVDCIGYTIARSRNIKFLTGDKQFKDLDNVEFVK